MREILKKICSFVQKPFTEGFHIYLLYTVLYCLPYVVNNIFFCDECSLKFVVWELLHDFIICYFTVLALYILPQIIRNIGAAILLILLLINSFVEASCLIAINSVFTNDMVSIILATNIGESKEFISTYFSLKILVVWIIIILFFAACLINKAALNKMGRYAANVVIPIVFMCVLYLGFKGTQSFSLKIYDKVLSFVKFEAPPDLRSYQEFNKYSALNDTPEYVVMIIGESFSKYHSSLYGYEKDTNPKLRELQNDSLLTVYDNVEAPALNTIEAFKRIMSTYRDDLTDSLAWYKCLALPTVMSSCGYRTVWISNQSPTGVYDNVATRYSELCDTSIFVGSTVRGVHRKDLDEEVLIKLGNYTFKDGEKYFIVLHLMGSHCTFSERYPTEKEIFKKEDYLKYSEKQRKTRAAYDNSILYNDLIVSEIFKLFEDKEMLGFYFSDHGLDVYRSSTDYCGHAISSDTTSTIAGKQIPFMMYTSESMKEEYPNITYQLDSVFAVGFNTGKILETVMSVYNIQER